MSDVETRVSNGLEQMEDQIQTLLAHISEMEFDMSEIGLEDDWEEIRTHLTSVSEVVEKAMVDLPFVGDELESEFED